MCNNKMADGTEEEDSKADEDRFLDGSAGRGGYSRAVVVLEVLYDVGSPIHE